jgi:hypothetical protein
VHILQTLTSTFWPPFLPLALSRSRPLPFFVRPLDLADLALNLAAAEIVFRRSNPNFTPLIAVDSSSSPVRSSDFIFVLFSFLL